MPTYARTSPLAVVDDEDGAVPHAAVADGQQGATQDGGGGALHIGVERGPHVVQAGEQASRDVQRLAGRGRQTGTVGQRAAGGGGDGGCGRRASGRRSRRAAARRSTARGVADGAATSAASTVDSAASRRAGVAPNSAAAAAPTPLRSPRTSTRLR